MSVEQGVSTAPTVKIVVSCHKEFPIPNSDIYVPVHVGAATAKAPLAGMQPDNEGENISERNFTFCELTAQYWAWKNLEADYVGQCHYRRYFCFANTDYGHNDHSQVEVETLSDASMRDLGLNDGTHIAEEVAQADITTAHWWDVRGVRTPRGASRTVAEHMTSYGLYSEEDLRLLRQIVAERQPDYLEDLDSYLQGDQYLGYNCFVMRRAAFDQLCAFEFDVLLEFDRQKDYCGLTRNQRRICGYLGEVLYSVFIVHVRRLGTFSIQERPLIFFDAVDPGLKVLDIVDAPATVQIVWNGTGMYFPDNWTFGQRETMSEALPLSLATCLKSLFAVADPATSYRLSLFIPDDFLDRRFRTALGKVPANIDLQLVTWVPSVGRGFLEQLDAVQRLDMLPALLPWLYLDVDARVLWVDGLAVFQRDPADVLRAYVDGSGITATSGIRFEKEFSRPGSFGDVDRAWRHTFRTFADSRLAVVDLVAARERWSLDHVRDVMTTSGFDQFRHGPRDESFACDALLSVMGAPGLGYGVVTPSVVVEDAENWGSAESLAAWEQAGEPAAVLIDDSPVPSANADFSRNGAFWDAARAAGCYEHLLAYACMEFSYANKERLRDRILPKGSKRREMAGRVLRIVKDTLR